MVKQIIYVVCFLFLSCTKVYNKKHFVLNKKIEVNSIKTDGYYYHIYDRNNKASKFTGKGIKMKILLKNGYFHDFKNGYGKQCGNNVNLECEIQMSEDIFNKYLNWKSEPDNNSNINLWDWGKFEIKKDSIRIQWFYNKFGDYYLIEEKGVVIDSTTFKLLKVIDYGTKKEYTKDEVYHFKKFDLNKIYKKTPNLNKLL